MGVVGGSPRKLAKGARSLGGMLEAMRDARLFCPSWLGIRIHTTLGRRRDPHQKVVCDYRLPA